MQCGPEVTSTIPFLVKGEHTLPINKIEPVVCSLIRKMKGRVAINSFGKLTAPNTIPVTAAASEPMHLVVNEMIHHAINNVHSNDVVSLAI